MAIPCSVKAYGGDAFDTAVWPTNDAYIWPTTLLCIVQSLYESIALYSVVLVSFFPVASGGGVAWSRDAKPTAPGAAGSTLHKKLGKTLPRDAAWVYRPG